MFIGVQDQALYTNVFRKMAGLSDNDKCHFCLIFYDKPTSYLYNLLRGKPLYDLLGRKPPKPSCLYNLLGGKPPKPSRFMIYWAANLLPL